MTISHFDFGDLKMDETIFDDRGKEIGKLSLHENGFMIRYETDDEDVSEKVSYANFISAETIGPSTVPDKIKAKISFMDMYGDKYNLAIIISDPAVVMFNALKRQSENKKKKG